MEKKTLSLHNQRIVEHYKHTTFFYKRFWYFSKGYAIHNGFYDKKHRTHLQALENANKVLAKIAGLTSSDKVLDAGCGVGGTSIWIAKNIGARVIGINISPLQLKIARKLVKDNKLDHLVTFYEQDYCNTEFPNEYFDVVWAHDSVCHAENKEAFVKEAFRILKPNGRLIVCDGFLSAPRTSLNSFYLKFLELFEEGFVLGKMVSIGEFKSYIKKNRFKTVKFIDKNSTAHRNFILGFIICLPLYPIFFILEKLHLVNPMIRKWLLTGIIQLPGKIMKFGRYGVFIAKK
jgi:cyclopropane fatty-acyl-phospholipid synthase-like methyltransferase